MLKIVHFICNNKINIADLLCNMVEEHFKTHGEELETLYKDALLKNSTL